MRRVHFAFTSRFEFLVVTLFNLAFERVGYPHDCHWHSAYGVLAWGIK
jgi:hypothetical protein